MSARARVRASRAAATAHSTRAADATATVLAAAFPHSSTFTDRPGDAAMFQFRQGAGARLAHTPDLVVDGWRGRGTYLLVVQVCMYVYTYL